jgi:hypothetical protein
MGGGKDMRGVCYTRRGLRALVKILVRGIFKGGGSGLLEALVAFRFACVLKNVLTVKGYSRHVDAVVGSTTVTSSVVLLLMDIEKLGIHTLCMHEPFATAGYICVLSRLNLTCVAH